jgi:hypothetical protein
VHRGAHRASAHRADFDQALSINEPSPIMSDRLLDRLGLQKVVVKTEESTD